MTADMQETAARFVYAIHSALALRQNKNARVLTETLAKKLGVELPRG